MTLDLFAEHLTRPDAAPLTLDEVRSLQAAGHVFAVSYGMGVDSTAMLIGLRNEGLRPDLILFADVGGEKAATYRYLDTINDWLESVGFPSVVVVAKQTTERSAIDPTTGRSYTTLEGQCLATGRLPSLAYRRKSCSVKWKTEPQRLYHRSWAPARRAWANGKTVIQAIGYDCSPADVKRAGRTFAPSKDDARYSSAYPLGWWGWEREDCKRVIAAEGLPVPPKSSCFFCPAMKAAEVVELAHTEPDLFRRALAMEDRAKQMDAERVAQGGKSSEVESSGLWTFNRPNNQCPKSWREFAEAEGLLPTPDRSVA